MNLSDIHIRLVRYIYSFGRPLFFCSLIFLLNTTASGQEKHVIQIKTFDQQLQPFKNVDISINNKSFIAIGNKGSAFTELQDNDLPIKSIAIKNEQLEAASWNYSKGILEIIIRKKSYQIIKLVVRDKEKTPLPNIKVTFNGKKTITTTTNAEGRLEIPVSLDEKLSSASQFAINDHRIVDLQLSEKENVLTADPIRPEPIAAQIPESEKPKEKEFFKDFDLSKLDSIQSLTVFYAIFKNYDRKEMSESAKRKVDAKFSQLVQQLQDSVLKNDQAIIGKISDSSFVSDDIEILLEQATQENQMLTFQRSDFDEKIGLINDKLAAGLENIDPATRKKLLSDLTLLERLLTENESRFYKNQNDYRHVINSLKEKFFDFENLENKLSESEAQRLEEQRIFRQRLLAISAVVLLFAILIILLISFSNKLKKQKKALVLANAEVKRINENLEGIVFERTKLLEEANRELDTFLYRASHDLRSPVCSIIGLCNIALNLSDGESKELVQRVANTTTGMDKLLKKLSIISEINQPTNFSSITLLDLVDDVRTKFSSVIKEHHVKFSIECPADLVFYSYPNLIEVIISNLIENALFYSVLKDPANARVEFKAAIKDNHVEMSVYDNGIGVAHNIRYRLFDMFFKGYEHSKGNGLGLYIVQKSVQALEGSIDVESEPGRFSKFIIQLPLQPMRDEPAMVQADDEVQALS